jgi:hypothetical protein
MAFGKLRKVWEKIKSVGRKVWGGLKKALPFIKPIAGLVANAFAPGSGIAVTKGFDIAENIGDAVAGGKFKNSAAGAGTFGAIGRLAGFKPMGERLQLEG